MKARIPISAIVVLAGLLPAANARAQTGAPAQAAAPAPAATPTPDPPPSPAPAAEILTLDEAVARALEHFPTVRGAREELAGTRAAVREEKAARLPSLKLSGSATRYEEPSIVHPIHAFNPGAFPPLNRTILQGGLAASYTLFDGGGRGARVREAEGQSTSAAEALAGSEQELIAQVATKYVEILARRQVLDAHKRRIEALRSERDRVGRFLQAGRAARVDSLRVQAALAAADAERVRLAAELALSESDLAGLTGIPPGRTRAANLVALALADTVIEPADRAIARALEENSDVRAARERATAAEASVRAAEGAYWPQLSLIGNYQVWGDPDGNSTGEWNVGLQLTQSLFSGGAVSSRVARRAAADRRAGESLRLARIQARRNVQAAHDRVREAAAGTLSLRAAVASYEEVARIEALARQAGSGTQTDYLTAEADAMNARARLADALRAEVAARLELARLTGELSTEWLARHLEARP